MEPKTYSVRELPDGPGIRLLEGTKIGSKYRIIVNRENGVISLVPEKLYIQETRTDETKKITSVEDLFE